MTHAGSCMNMFAGKEVFGSHSRPYIKLPALDLPQAHATAAIICKSAPAAQWGKISSLYSCSLL